MPGEVSQEIDITKELDEEVRDAVVPHLEAIAKRALELEDTKLLQACKALGLLKCK